MPADPSGAAELVLRRRAEALARPPSRAGQAPTDALLIFLVGDTRAGVPVHRVREVLAPGLLLRLPGNTSGLAGLRPARRSLVPVIDPSIIVGSPSAVSPHHGYVVVLDGADPLGLVVDAVLGLVPRTVNVASTERSARFTLGITADRVVVLDVDEIITAERFIVQ